VTALQESGASPVIPSPLPSCSEHMGQQSPREGNKLFISDPRHGAAGLEASELRLSPRKVPCPGRQHFTWNHTSAPRHSPLSSSCGSSLPNKHMLGERMKQKDRTTTWKEKEDQHRPQQRTWTGITSRNKHLSPKPKRTAQTPSQTPGLKPLTMVQVFAAAVLVVDCLTKACSFRNCSSSDLQESRQRRLTQRLSHELHAPLLPASQPRTGHNLKKRNSLPHHISRCVQQRELTCSPSAAAAPSSPARGSELCRQPPFPAKMSSTEKEQRGFVSQQQGLHQSLPSSN